MPLNVFFDIDSLNYTDSISGNIISPDEVKKRIKSSHFGYYFSKPLNDDNYDYVNGILTDLQTGEVFPNFEGPVPTGPISLSKMSKEELEEIRRFNDLQQKKLDSGNFRYFGSKRSDDEDLDAQLFL